MIPASILLIILVAADAISHVALWLRAGRLNERAEDIVDKAFDAKQSSVVKVADYEREMSDLKYEIRRARAWSKMPDDFKF